MKIRRLKRGEIIALGTAIAIGTAASAYACDQGCLANADGDLISDYIDCRNQWEASAQTSEDQERRDNCEFDADQRHQDKVSDCGC